MMIAHLLPQLLYVALCLASVGSIVTLQGYRLKHARGCRWWLYNLLAIGLAYEALEAAFYGAPDFPAGRWFVVPGLASTLLWSAIEDWNKRRTF